MLNNNNTVRKIIHVDMDCFFAAIEMRDNPSLANKPVAVGGSPEGRGVLATCNYIARKYGLHSAMSSARAIQLCPKLILLPGNFDKYRQASKVIYRIFKQYTPLVEMFSLDEAFLDVTNCPFCKGSATLIAQTIKMRIKKELRLTASAGVAPNKFLAKIASEWNKPDGLFVITPTQIPEFIKTLAIEKLPGVGKVTAKKMYAFGIKTCEDLQNKPLPELIDKFGGFGESLYDLCRGIDDREIETEWTRKSLSVEETFPTDLKTPEECLTKFPELFRDLTRRLESEDNLPIHKQFIKIKFFDFKQTTAEKVVSELDVQHFIDLFQTGFKRHNKPVRLLGVGVRFKD
jgi:DNA polymerase IV